MSSEKFAHSENEWGKPRIDAQIQKNIKNGNNKKFYANQPQSGDNCCKHWYNEELSSVFSVASVTDHEPQSAEESPFAEVSFKCKRKRFYRNDKKFKLDQYEYVIAEVESGVDIGTVCSCGNIARDKIKMFFKGEEPKFSIVRHANQEDLDRLKRNNADELNVVEKTREFVENFHLDMKVTEAEWQLDRQRLTIYFTAPSRIDFRELVKELARTFKTRIELRQISSREEAKRIGGMGPCGLGLCCSSFVNEFHHVTLDHARTQQLANNVAKLSGYCGRLKCCLLYEHDSYLEEYKKYPSINSTVDLGDTSARIVKIDIFKKLIFLGNGHNGNFKVLTADEIYALEKNGKIKPPEKGDNLPQIEYEDLDELAFIEEDLY